jgi:predicted ABC-type ATPase
MAKWMWIIGGPNGAGKTTFTNEFKTTLSEVWGMRDLTALNADDLAEKLRPRHLDKPLDAVNLMAVQETDATLLNCIRSGKDILIETVLSTDKYRDDVLEAKDKGYKIGFVYVSLDPAELSPARVDLRTKKGGHDVPVQKALERLEKSHAQAAWFAAQADFVAAFDNSSCESPVLIASKLAGREIVLREPGINQRLDRVFEALTKKRGDSPSPG